MLERSPIVLDNKKIAEQIKNKVILITGAAGSIGSEIVYQILNFQPTQIILLDQAETPLYHLSVELEKINKEVKVVPIVADIKDKRILEFININ